mmetsp:Transcript_168529/g.535940  ORF Transcript_168529/g.535940 Transcript_168529/m.535940 type:complete len:89 (+) Transcript_168529:1-267(+)
MARACVELDSITYSGALLAFAKGGEWAKALWLLAETGSARVELSTIIYSSAISACDNGGESTKALGLEFLSDMQQSSLASMARVCDAL